MSDSWTSLAGAAKLAVDEERARVAKIIEELADNFMSMRRLRSL